MIRIEFNDGQKNAQALVDGGATLSELMLRLIEVAEFAGYHAKSADYIIDRYLVEKTMDADYSFKEFLIDEVWDE